MGNINLTNDLDCCYLTDADAIRNMLGSIQSEATIGLDTETYWDIEGTRPRVSLVQVATPSGQVVVVDALVVGLEVLRPLIESPDILMAAHNARFDEMVLTGGGVQPKGFVDTLSLARIALNLSSYSLAAVAEHLLGIALDKSLRTSNWRRRPLTHAQITYAATDAIVTLRVYEELQHRLREQGRLDEAMRVSMLSGAAQTSQRRRRAPRPSSPPLTAEEKRVVAQLKKWRLDLARNGRVPAYMICPDRTLEHIAHARPATLEALRSIYGLGDAKIASYGEELLEAAREAYDRGS